MVDVLDAEVHRARSDGFAEAVVGVVVVLREDGLPALDEAGRHGLRADVHQAPLVELVVLQLHVAAFDGVQDVLRPRHEQPHHGAVLLGDRADDPFGLDAAQEHGLAADQETAEPVHLRAGVVQRRDAEERVFAGLSVVLLLHDAGVHEAAVTVHDGLREAGGAGGEVDRGVLLVGERDRGRFAGAVGNEAVVRLGERRAVLADVDQRLHARHAFTDGFHAADERGAEDEHVDVGELDAVFDLLGGVAEVEGHGHRAALQHAEVDREPFEAVHEQDADAVALLDVAREQEVRHAVRLAVEFAPGEFGAEGVGRARLHQGVFTPGGVAFFEFLRVDFHQCDVVLVELGVPFEDFGDRHRISFCDV